MQHTRVNNMFTRSKAKSIAVGVLKVITQPVLGQEHLQPKEEEQQQVHGRQREVDLMKQTSVAPPLNIVSDTVKDGYASSRQ